MGDLMNPMNPLNMVNPASPWYHVYHANDEDTKVPHEVIQVTADVTDKATAFGLFGVISLVVVISIALALFVWAVFFKD